MSRAVRTALTWFFLLAGCATPLKPNQVEIVFNTEPPGAMIYDGGRAWGIAPRALILTASERDMRLGYSEQNNVFAVWPSGAKSNRGVRIPIGRKRQQFTFSRPSDAPGLDKDLAHAAQLRQTAFQEKAANDAAWEDAMKAWQPQKSITCRTFGAITTCD